METLTQVLIQYPAVGVLLYVVIELMKLMKQLNTSISELTEAANRAGDKSERQGQEFKEEARREWARLEAMLQQLL